MTDRELKKLSRAELLELLLEEGQENERLRAQLEKANQAINDKKSPSTTPARLRRRRFR